jgi:hypothetical protein
MARRKNTKRIDPRYFLRETAYRDLDEMVYKMSFDNRAEYALTWALAQRGGSGLVGQEVSLEDINGLLTSPSVAEIYQKLQSPMDRKPFTAEDAVEGVRKRLSPDSQDMKYSRATGYTFGIIQPDTESGKKQRDGMVFNFSPGIEDETKIIWHGVSKSQEKQPRYKEPAHGNLTEDWGNAVKAQDVSLEGHIRPWLEANKEQLRNHDDLLQLFMAAANEAGIITGTSLSNVPGADSGVINQALNIYEKFMKGMLP